MKLSIIVPIYQVEAYLPRCLDSVLAQTFKDFELILVDDGSPDLCGEIIEEYAKKDARICTIHQENCGVSAARNAGLRIAKGKYIGFVDPDDYIAPNRYELVLTAVEHSHAQLGICNFEDVNDNQESASSAPVMDTELKILSQRETAEELFHIPPSIYGAVCNKLFLRELITEEFDVSARLCEDNLFFLRYIENIEKAVWVKAPLYYVFNRPGSATRSGSQKYVESLAVRKQMCQVVKESSFPEVYEVAYRNYADNCISTLMKLDKGTSERKIVQRIIRESIPQIMSNKKIPWKEKCLCISLLLK